MIGIYSITHIASDKKYIGSSRQIRQRWVDHMKMLRRGVHHSRTLQRAWNKYGEDAFSFEILEECQDANLKVVEQHYLDTIRPFASQHRGFNENVFADRPPVHYGHGRQPWPTGMKRPPRTEEHKRKLSEALRGSKKTPRTAEHMANIWAKRRENGTDKHTEEAKRRCGAKNLGKPLSSEHRKNISAALIGKPQPEGHGKRVWEIRRANGLAASAYKGIPRSEEVKRKISESKSCLYAAIGFSL